MLIKSIVKYIPATDTHIYDKKNFIYSEIIFALFLNNINLYIKNAKDIDIKLLIINISIKSKFFLSLFSNISPNR
jgi:hypothetical protein